MKKLFNGRFLFILASSLVVLILLVVGAFFLFNDEDDKFVKSGYILNPLSSTAEKYFFEEDVGYKENLSSMIEFVDIDEKKVSILKDSFIHYNDESLSFMKKGAILDLDSIKGDSPVAFYNITGESIIERTGDSYIIKTANGDIKLDNFIGRISENKYIVVGDLSLRMVGNSTDIKAEYFEVVYVEEGIVNIENKEIKYQVAADGTVINVGNDKVIDLGDKKISVNGADAMSITAITIDGDENIEIIPGAKEEEEDDDNDGSNGDGVGEDGQIGTGDNVGNDIGDNQTGQENPGDNDDTTDEDDKETKKLEITLIPEKTVIYSSSIAVGFKIDNAGSDDSFDLRVTHLETDTTMNTEKNIISEREEPYSTTGLEPSTKYMFRIINNKNDQTVKTFILETAAFGVKLEKKYATDYSLAFDVYIDENSGIDDADIILERFDDDNVMDFVSDINDDGKMDDDEGKKSLLTGCEREEPGKYSCVFGEVNNKLKSDSIYRVKMNNFKSGQYTTGEEIPMEVPPVSVMTLKKRPKFAPEEMTATTNEQQDKFIVDIGSVEDENNAIINYKYLIYEYKDNTLLDDPVMPPLLKKDNSSFTIDIAKGDETPTTLSLGKTYKYKVVVEYFDNEKYYEFVSPEISDEFQSGDAPKFTIVQDDKAITDKTIGATIKITDIGCKIPRADRVNCGGEEMNIIVRVTERDDYGSPTGESIDLKNVNFKVDSSGNIIEGTFNLDKISTNGKRLTPGYRYTVDVYAGTDDENGKIQYVGDVGGNTIFTKTRASFDVKWDSAGKISDEENVINTSIQLVGSSTSDSTMNFEDTAGNIKLIDISIYRGDTGGKKDSEFIVKGTWKESDGINIKEKFFDNKFDISSSLPEFDLSYELLKSLNKEENGEYVNQYYTLVVEAWYSEGRENSEIVTLGRNDIYRYMVSSSLLREIDVELEVKDISHAERNLEMNQYLNNSSTTVGYGINIGFDWNSFEDAKNWIPKNVYIYVYNQISGEKLNFYYLDDNGVLKLTSDKRYVYPLKKGDSKIDIGSSDRIVEIFMNPGTLYDLEKPDDKIMTRGNYFVIGYDIEYEYITDDGKDTSLFDTPVSISGNSKFAKDPENEGKGIYVNVYEEKEKPHLSMYPLTSDASSITYKYELSDPDNALYREDNGYYFHINANDVSKSVEMVPVADSPYNKFNGELKIDELSKGMSYSYYYKMNILKSGKPQTDIKDVIDGFNPANRKFDGEYRLAENSEEYKFSYKIVSKDEETNNVIIDFSSIVDEAWNRILSIRVNLKDKNGNEFNYELDESPLKDFVVCPGAPSTATPKCLSIDYTSIKKMKSTTKSGGENPITVKVTAIYDNGLTGYDLVKKLGKNENDENPYMIMQDNSTGNAYGSYITHNYSGEKLTLWKNELYQVSKTESVMPAKGYFVWRERKDSYFYTNKRFDKFSPVEFELDDLVLDANGYKYSGSDYTDIIDKYFNPKMVSVDEVPCSGDPVFKFYLIEPKVKTSVDTKLVNGFVVDLKLSSFDTDSVKNEGTEENPIYYAYVEVWDYDNSSKAFIVDENDIDKDKFVANRARPRVKVRVDKNGRVLEQAIVDGLLDIEKHPQEYRYGVYAYMLKMDENNNLLLDENGDPLYVYKRIADADIANRYETKTYLSKVASKSELYNGLDYRYDPGNDFEVNPFEDNREFKYGDRILSTTFNLLAYSKDIPLNYNIHYVLCNVKDCGKGFNADKQNGLLVETIENDRFKEKTSAINYVDLREHPDIEFGKTYNVFVYFEYNYYTSDDSIQMDGMKNFLVGSEYDFYLDQLIKPDFSFTRSAGVIDEDGSYYIDFGIKSSDDDHSFDKTSGDQVLKDGKYKIKLQEIVYDIEEPDKEVDRIDIIEGMNGYENFKMQICDAGVCSDVTDDYLNYEFSADVLNQNVRMIGLKPQTEYAITAYGDAYLNNYGLSEEKKDVEVIGGETAYTTNIYGLAFGRANYEISANSWTITFSGASNLKDNKLVKSIDVEIKNHATGVVKPYTSTKGFEPIPNSNNLKIVIETDKNTVGTEYDILIRITLNKIDPMTNKNIVIDSSINRSFAAYKKPYSTTNT